MSLLSQDLLTSSVLLLPGSGKTEDGHKAFHLPCKNMGNPLQVRSPPPHFPSPAPSSHLAAKQLRMEGEDNEPCKNLRRDRKFWKRNPFVWKAAKNSPDTGEIQIANGVRTIKQLLFNDITNTADIKLESADIHL